jgi:hypothetical protein
MSEVPKGGCSGTPYLGQQGTQEKKMRRRAFSESPILAFFKRGERSQGLVHFGAIAETLEF